MQVDNTENKKKADTIWDVCDRMNDTLNRECLGDILEMNVTTVKQANGFAKPVWILKFVNDNIYPMFFSKSLDNMDEQVKLYFKLGCDPNVHTFIDMNNVLNKKYGGNVKIANACRPIYHGAALRDYYVIICVKCDGIWYVYKEIKNCKWACVGIELAQFENRLKANGKGIIASIPTKCKKLSECDYLLVKDDFTAADWETFQNTGIIEDDYSDIKWTR